MAGSYFLLALLYVVTSFHTVHTASLCPAMICEASREQLIKLYFLEGYKYRMIILVFLGLVHGIVLSLRQLKRIIRKLRLRKKTIYTTPLLQDVDRCIRVRMHVTPDCRYIGRCQSYYDVQTLPW